MRAALKLLSRGLIRAGEILDAYTRQPEDPLRAEINALAIEQLAMIERIRHINPGIPGLPEDQREKYVDCGCPSCPTFLDINSVDTLCSTCKNLGCD